MLKVVAVLVGLLFTLGIYTVTMILWQRDQSGYTDAMMLSLYVALGIFLLISGAEPIGASQPDRLRRMVDFAHAAVRLSAQVT